MTSRLSLRSASEFYRKQIQRKSFQCTRMPSRDHQYNHRQRSPEPGSGKIRSSSGRLKNLARTHRPDRPLKALHSHPREPNLFSKIPVNNTANVPDTDRTCLRIPAISQRFSPCARVLERRSQPISGF